MAHVKLHIPGPVEVSEKTFKAFCSPMIGHRGQGYKDLVAKIQPQLQTLLGTKQLVYLSTSSAWGVMEGALHNVVQKKVLNCMNGAFSDKWNDVALRDDKQATALKFEWGQPVDPEAIRRELSKGGYDAITLIHNETSCGCMSNLAVTEDRSGDPATPDASLTLFESLKRNLTTRAYAQFSGRASRAEFWWFVLGTTLLSIAAGTIDALIPGDVVGSLFSLFLIYAIPNSFFSSARFISGDS